MLFVFSNLLPAVGIQEGRAAAADTVAEGDYITFGSYDGIPLKWQVIKIDGNGYMLFAADSIGLKPFDANGDGTDGRTDANREAYGSNFWEKSNLREWLNSSDTTVAYSHQKPDSSHVYNYYYAYDQEPGFLSNGNFTAQERALIQPVTHKTLLASIDGAVQDGGTAVHAYSTSSIRDAEQNYNTAYYMNVTDKVFLLSVQELIELYNRDPATDGVNFPSVSGTFYWLRDPNANLSYSQRLVNTTGSNINVSSAYNFAGVRPALYLKAGIVLSGMGTSASPYTVDAGGAAQSSFTATATSLPANGTMFPILKVTRLDAFGHPLAGHQITIEQGSGNSIITPQIPFPSSATTNGSGEAYFSVGSTKAEVVIYSAYDSTDAVTMDQRVQVTYTPGAPSVSSPIDASPSQVEANGSAAATITVTLTDALHNPIAGHTISLSQGTGSSTITPVSAVTSASGQASFSVTNTKSESVTYRAKDETENVTMATTAQIDFTVGGVVEQFGLATGKTYYFDLSGEAGHIGTIYSTVPDTTLHYVPFTYAGTVNAYSLDSSSSGDSNASLTATVNNRSLFVADYALSHSVSWNTLNGNGLIFGKTYHTNYKLRSLSVGNTAGTGTPTTNEWDRILDKNDSLIRNGFMRSIGQDTSTVSPLNRVVRGGEAIRNELGIPANDSEQTAYGYRPALEVLNVGALGYAGLKDIRLELGDGSLQGATSIHIVSVGGSFTAPGSEGLTQPGNRAFDKWNTAEDGSGTSYAAGASVPDTVTVLYAQWEPTSGGTYYFDLSGEIDHIGTVNTAVPDTSLHYVPFTYTGTIQAYSLDSSSNNDTEASSHAPISSRKLFVADYVVSHTVSWDALNMNGLIFGKVFDTKYTLRSLSGGSEPGVNVGTPTTNEWDQILNGNAAWIRNWSTLSWVQDTGVVNADVRATRGGTGVNEWIGVSHDSSSNNRGFRPVLEIRNGGTQGADGLKDVSLNLGSGSVNGSNLIHIISPGEQFAAPSGTGLTPPANMVFARWQKTGDPSTTYATGQSVAYESGLGLTAEWESVATPEVMPAIVVDYAAEQLTGFVVGGSYTIDAAPVTPVGGKLDVASYIGATISIVKKGNGTTTTDSAQQNVMIPARPAAPTAAGVDPTTIGGTGSITGATAGMEYQLSAGAWNDVTGTTLAGLAPGTYHMRVKSTASSFKGAEQTVTITALTPGAEATPAIAIDYANEQLTGFVVGGSYTIDAAPVTPVGGKLDVAGYIGTTVAIVKEGNGTTTTDSAAQNLTIPVRPTAPTATGIDPTTIGGTGSITGVTSAMEYQLSAGAWADVTGTELTGLASGTYHIRVKATVNSFKGAEQTVTLTDPPPIEYTVNISNGGIGANGNGSYTSGVTVIVYAGSRSGYTFTGWTSIDGVTFANAGSATTSFVMPTQNLTVTANWSYNGGSSEIMPGITIDKKPGQPTMASMNLTAAVDQNRVASITITESQVKALIDAANKEAQNKGNTADGIGVAFHLPFGADVTGVMVKLEEGALALLEKEGAKRFDVHTGLVSFSFDQTAIQEMKSQTAGDVTIGAKPVTKLSEAAKVWIGNRPVYDLTVGYQKYGTTEYVTNFGKGVVTLGISYDAASDEKVGDLYVVYVNKSGKPQLLIRSSYNNGKLIFNRNSLSIYGVGDLAPAPAFRDTAKHWAKDDIAYVASRGVISGIEETSFLPDTAISRADFLMALGVLSGADMIEYKRSSFTDVSGISTAMPYIEWAVQNKIVQGVGNNRFDPNSPITREQMAVMMVDYAIITGYTLPANRQAVTFADDAIISSWAKEAVKAIQQTGIVNGKNNNQYDPAGKATRAEASTILRRFVEFVIDEGTTPLE